MRENLETIKNTISGERTHQRVREIANFHRIQASTGYRAAAEHVCQRMQADGLNAVIGSYAADGKTWYLTSKMFKEWDCRDAWLQLTTSESRLADFKTNAISILQKSYPCDHRQEPLPIVMLDKGTDPSAYEGLDLKGKLIFVREHFEGFMDWAVKERGAAGIVTDFIRAMTGVRERYELLDIRNYTSFWWKHTPDEPQTFGFVLTPRQGDELAALCKKTAEEHAKDPAKDPYPMANCYVDSSIYDGHIEVVDAFLPGETDEEILVVAHLCHPRMSANDNASGVAASMEALKVLHDLTAAGKLQPLKRGVRVLFVPEFTGTYAYLAELGEGKRKVKAGINLDMVGGRQSYGYGPLTLSGYPHACPSFVLDLAALVLDDVKKNVTDMSRDESIAMFNSAISEFEGGSDHYVLSDPAINIPTFMLGQWPDFNYHTSGDTPEAVDPFILHKSASICATYVYTLANLTLEDALLVMNRSRERFMRDLSHLVKRAAEKKSETGWVFEKIQHLTWHYQGGNSTFGSYFSGDERATVEKQVESENRLLKTMAEGIWTRYCEDYAPGYTYTAPEMPAEYAYIPYRKAYPPPMHLDDFALGDADKLAKYKAFTKEKSEKLTSGHVLDGVIQFYIDGERTLWDVARLALLETDDGSVEYVHEFVQLLKLLDIVGIKGD